MTSQQGAPEALRFTKKPVTIEAIQWTGKNLREVIAFTDGPPDTRTTHAGMAWEAYTDLVARDGLKIYTLEGKMLANPGDWIIRGVKGEYYPCKPDIFEATYSPAALVEAQQPAPSAAAPVGEAPLPLLVRDIAADLGTTPIQVCTALAQLGFGGHSVNMVVTPRMAKSLRAHFASPTPHADSQPAPSAAPAEERVKVSTQPICNACGAYLMEVKQDSNSYLSAEQFDADKLGDWYCIGAGGVSPLRNAAQETEATHLRELAAPSTDQVEEILRERDDADDFIDALLDEVLGPERPEWSSAYGRADALNDVRERMTALHKPAVDKAWDRFQSAMEAPQQPAPSPVPAGWKLVPVEPTEEMLKAADDGDDAYTLRCFGPGVQRVMQGPYDHYCAMLDAAPTAQADTQPAQQGVSYAALPESFLEIPDVQDESGINAYYSREVVLECIDAALASHGQAPARAPADSVLEDAARYRHLRDCNSGSLAVMQITGTDEDDWFILTEDDADAAIDAAMNKGGAA